jgi:hypothetical protein
MLGVLTLVDILPPLLFDAYEIKFLCHDHNTTASISIYSPSLTISTIFSARTRTRQSPEEMAQYRKN